MLANLRLDTDVNNRPIAHCALHSRIQHLIARSSFARQVSEANSLNNHGLIARDDRPK